MGGNSFYGLFGFPSWACFIRLSAVPTLATQYPVPVKHATAPSPVAKSFKLAWCLPTPPSQPWEQMAL